MSRSRKKTMSGGNTTASSERQDKKIWHKSFRSVNKIILKYYDADSETKIKTVKEISDPWTMDKDGKNIYTTELEIRSFLDAVIDEIFRTGDFSWNSGKHAYPAIKIYRELCFYLKKKKKSMRQINDITRNNFIKYYINKEKRK